jgi:hypothetical protein
MPEEKPPPPESDDVSRLLGRVKDIEGDVRKLDGDVGRIKSTRRTQVGFVGLLAPPTSSRPATSTATVTWIS